MILCFFDYVSVDHKKSTGLQIAHHCSTTVYHGSMLFNFKISLKIFFTDNECYQST